MNKLISLLLLGCLSCGHVWAAPKKPLQVYILAGQSNMQGHGKVTTFEHIGMDPATKPMLEAMTNPDGSPRVCERVWISALGCDADESAVKTGKLTAGFGAGANGPKIGPEFTFGLHLEKTTDAPILLIKTAWGGKSLHTDFRPPSAGPFVFSEAQLANFTKQGKDPATARTEKDRQTGVYYMMMFRHVKKVLADIKSVVPGYDPAQGYELAGFVWFQGWNDMVAVDVYPNRDKRGGYDDYSTLLAHLIRDVRRDFDAPKMPFVIGVMGVGGPVALYGPENKRYATTHQNFRDAMAAPALLPEFKGNVAAVLTEKYWDGELSSAKAKENLIREKAKKLATDGKLKPAEEKALLDKLISEGMTQREREIVAKGISNFEFHYYGSAKILGGIGQGLAEAALELSKNRR